MLIKFSAEKLIQAAAIVLKATEGQRMTYLRLLKLLYLAERRSITETGFPITGDGVVAMDHGPVLTRAYDCIKGRDFESPRWARCIEREGKWELHLVEDPGVGKLSRFEIATLQQVTEEHEDQGEWELVRLTHTFPEWSEHYVEGTSRPIPVEEILKAVGLEDAIPEILAEARAQREFSSALAGAAAS